MLKTYEEAVAAAKKLQAMPGRKNTTYVIAKHVGDSGRPGGDIPATGDYAVKTLEYFDVPRDSYEWAGVAIVRPGDL